MPCVGFDKLERYATGAAAAAERAEVELHAAACEACRLTLAAVGLAFEPGSPEEEALVAWMASSRPVDALLDDLRIRGVANDSAEAGHGTRDGGGVRLAALAGGRSEPRHGAPAATRRSYRWRMVAGGFAAAAAVAATVVLLPNGHRDPAWMTQLQPAYRATEARPSAAIHYAPFRPVRGLEPRDRFESELGKLLGARSSDPVSTPSFLAAFYLWRGEMGDHERALEELATLPESPRRENDRGALLLARGDVDGALHAFDKALAGEPGFGPALFNRALALEALGRMPAAAEAWRSYLERADEDPAWLDEARIHLGRITAGW